MEFAKAKIENVIYDVVTEEEYAKNPSCYRGSFVAIKKNGYLYPARTNPRDFRPGFVDYGGVIFFTDPKNEECSDYNCMNIIDFSQAGCLKDVIETQAKLASTERAILTTVDSVFIPPTSPDDSPEMALLKSAIIEKQIDLSKYEYRFGSNFNNDKRLVKKNTITFEKLKKFCSALDIKATLTLEDRDSDVPNPIGKKLEACITDFFEEEDGE